MSTFLLGDQGTSYTIGEGFSAGEIFAWEFTAEESGWLEILEVLTNAVTPTATSLALGVYADASGTPGALLGEAVHAGKPSASTWTAATLASRVQIFKGTKYWLATLPLGGNFEANLTTEHGSDRHQVGAGNAALKAGTWEAANKTSLGLRGMGTPQSFLNFPKFRGTSVPTVSGPKNATTGLPLNMPTGATNEPKPGDLILVQAQATTNEARWPKVTIKGSLTWHMAGEEGKDLESGGQQTIASFYGIVPESGVGFGIEVNSSESCTLNAVVVVIKAGTFNTSEPVKASGYRESSVEGVCPTPAVTGLTSTIEYLALGLFGYKSGKVKELTGWTADAMEGKYAQLHREWTGITTTGEVAFTKSGTPRAMTMMLLVLPPSGKSESRSASDSLSIAEAGERTVSLPHGSVDTLSLSESATSTVTTARSVADALGMADVGSRSSSGPRARTDALTMVEAAIANASSPRPAGDALGLTDAATRALTLPRSSTDALSLADAGTRVTGAPRPAADALGLADVASMTKGVSRAATDVLSIAEGATRSISPARAATDTLGLAEAALRVWQGARRASDGLGLAEAGSAVGGSARAASDTLHLGDAGSRTLVAPRPASDALSITEAGSVANVTTRNASDTLGFADVGSHSTVVTATLLAARAFDRAIIRVRTSDGALVRISASDRAVTLTTSGDN